MDPLLTTLVVAATNALIALGTWLTAQNSKRGREIRKLRKQLDDAMSVVYSTRRAALRVMDESDLPDITALEEGLEGD